MAKKKEKIYNSLSDELYEKLDECWEVNYGSEGASFYFSVSGAHDVAEEKIKEIAILYNKWYAKRVEKYLESPLDFQDMEEDDGMNTTYHIFISEIYGNGKS